MEIRMHIDKDTRVCMSLAARPGNFGTRFHNFLFDELGLNFIYKAFSTTNLEGAIAGIRALGIRGCAISMPFKEPCIPFLDELTESARAIQSVNTIVNDHGYLRAYNTDYIAIRQLLDRYQVSRESSFAVLGSGGMAKAVVSALSDAGFRFGFVIARNEVTGQRLAQSCGYEWRKKIGSLRPEILINVTPVGMAGGSEADDLAFDPAVVDESRIVFDVVALPPVTPLIRYATHAGKVVISGAEVAAIQALEQFVLYTGVRPTPEQVERAATYARAH